MTKYWLAIAATLFMFACDDKGDDTGDTGEADADTDTDTDADAPSSVSVSWGGSALTLTVSDDGPGGYWFGIAETNAACGDECWTGEDCYLGYELNDGSVLSYCHDAGDGGTLTLAYGGDPTALAESEETVFSGDYEGIVTFYLYSDSAWGGNEMCWVWGLESSYYNALGCEDKYGEWGD